MEKPSEYVRPFAATEFGYGEQIGAAVTRRKRFFRRCYGCCAALIVINIIVSVMLIFTLFKPRDTIFRINKMTVEKIELINGTNTPRPGSNATINADLSVRNPNYISFKHPLATSTVHYRGVVIGEARTPPGTQRARRTLRMNVTFEVILDRFLSAPGLGSDVKSGLFTMWGYSRVSGTAKFLFIKKHVRVKMNCTATVNVTSLEVLHQKCKKKIKF